MVKLVMQEVNKSNLQNKIIVSSFDWRTLTEMKKFTLKFQELI